MKFNTLPKQEEIQKVLSYDESTGAFTWRFRDNERAWNTKQAGKVAGTITRSGYIVIHVGYKRFRAHRLAWVYANGDVLDDYTEVDHINRNRSDNRISNLRTATKSQNMGNSIGHSKTGLPKGVVRNKKRFSARFMADRKLQYLGTFDTATEAHEAYMRAAVATKGEFARSS